MTTQQIQRAQVARMTAERTPVTAANRHHVVQAQFELGGKPYHYFCPGAEVGDIIKAPSNSRATVVALGTAGQLGTGTALRTATIIERNTTMNEAAKSHTYSLGASMTAEHHEAEAKRLRKAEKSCRKADRARAAAEAEKARLHRLAIETLADVAENASLASVRADAATRLLAALGCPA